MPTLPQILEAILQASETPLSSKELVETLLQAAKIHQEEEEDTLDLPKNIDESTIEAALADLTIELEQQNRAITIRKKPQGWKFVTRPEFFSYIRGMYPDSKPARLSIPALETLAIVAYRQPISRSEIEAIRGVSVDAMMQKLLDLGLIRIQGRSDKPGRPLLYSTTLFFLEQFNLEKSQQLPNYAELSGLDLLIQEEEELAPQPELNFNGKSAADSTHLD